MNTDIRLQIGWRQHPKVVKLYRKLGAEGVLALVTLWTWVRQNRPNGVIGNMKYDDIGIIANFQGNGNDFVNELVRLQLLDCTDNGFAIHNWLIHQPDAMRQDIPFPYDWNRRRYTVFIRDNFTCQYCGIAVKKPHCDHIIPRSRGGSDEIKNLVTACPTCNLCKNARTPEEWLS